jgi:putative FmdB family regulatory protein
MAIFRYLCRICNIEFEFMKIRSDEVAECPKCETKGEENLERQIPQGTSHILKGSGWARDNYGGGGKKR